MRTLAFIWDFYLKKNPNIENENSPERWQKGIANGQTNASKEDNHLALGIMNLKAIDLDKESNKNLVNVDVGVCGWVFF